MRAALFILTALATLCAHAEPIAHINGDAHSRVLAKMFFPDMAVMASPGADGLLVWKKLDGSKTDVAIQVALAAHFLPLATSAEDYAQTHELLAVLASSDQALVAKPEFPVNTVADIKKLGRPVSVGWIGHACSALVRDAFKQHNVDMIYVPYKTPQEAMGAFLGGHVDFVCPAASSLRQVLSNGTGKVVLDLTKHHHFSLTTSVFVNRDMPEEEKRKLLQQVTRKLTDEDRAVAENNGFTLYVKTGRDAKNIFDRDRKVWKTLLRE